MTLSLNDLRVIDFLCDRYETDSRSGKGTRVEELLVEIAPHLRSAALSELLRVDFELARRNGSAISLEEYRQRFSRDHDVLESVLAAEMSGASTSDLSSERPTASGPAVGAPSTLAESGAASADGVGSGRYRTIRLHAQGGLGRIWVATDVEMNREVALKEMLIDQAQYPEHRARFLLEAEITGRLEHPGIVPVYGQGIAPDGQPFYAMRLIQGQSFDEAIRILHQPGRGSPFSADRAFELRKQLGTFIALCNIIEFAHSRGVVHRDIKPANVMLGAFGETLVVDWGLAKLVKEPTTARSASSAASDTAAPATDASPASQNIICGTPQYMSPEQASSQTNRVGPVSDVYSLGVTLYQLLAGQPAFPGGSSARVLAAVARGEFAAPRKRNPGIPQALNAICIKAMSLRPEERYQSARLLAEDVERWLADEPVHAFPDSRGMKWSRFARRHTAWVGSVAAALFLVAVAASMAAWNVDVARRRAESSEQVAIAAREHETRQRQAALSTTSVLASLFESTDPLGVTKLGFGEANDGKNFDAARELLDRGQKLVISELSDEPLYQAKLLNALGLAYIGAGDLEAAESLLDRAWRVRQSQITAGALSRQHPDVLASLWSNAVVKHLHSEMDQAEAIFREVLAAQQKMDQCPPLAIARTQFHLGFVLHEIHRDADAEPLFRAAVETRQSYLEHSHLEVAWARMMLIVSLIGQDKKLAALEEVAKLVQPGDVETTSAIVQGFLKFQEVEEFRRKRDYEATVAAFRPLRDDAIRIFGNQHPLSIVAQFEYAGMLSQKGDMREAERVTLRTLQQLPPIIANNPRVAEIHFKLAQFLARRGAASAAERHFRDAIRIGGRVQVKEHTWGLRAGIELANWKLQWGDPASADQVCRDVIRQAANRPDSVSGTESVLVHALLNQGKFDEAIPFAHRHYERVWNMRHDVPDAAVHWSQVYAQCLRDRGDFKAARTIDAKAFKWVQECLSQPVLDNKMERYQVFGRFLAEHGDLTSADRMWRLSSEEARQHLAPKHPDLASALVPVARFLADHGSSQDAADLFRDILEIQREKLGGEHLATTESELLLADLQEKSGDAIQAISRAREARQTRIKQFGPDDLNTINSSIRLANLLRRQRPFEEAEALMREALSGLQTRLLVTDERLWQAHLDLADLLLEKRDFIAATEALEAAKDRMQTAYPPRSWRVAEITSRLGLSYSEAGRRAEAVSLLESSLAILTDAFGLTHSRTQQASDRLEHAQRRTDSCRDCE